MGILKGLRDLVFEEDENLHDAPVQQPVTPTTVTTPIEMTVKPTSENIMKYREYFDRLFDESNLPGPDYYEFSKVLSKLIGNLEEPKAFQTAFDTLAAMGPIDKQKLLDTAQQYLNILATDNHDFLAQLKKTADVEIAAKQDRITSLGNTIKERKEQIAKLEAQIEVENQEIAKMHGEIAVSSGKIEEAKHNYMTSSMEVNQKINKHIEKIKTLIT